MGSTSILTDCGCRCWLFVKYILALAGGTQERDSFVYFLLVAISNACFLVVENDVPGSCEASLGKFNWSYSFDNMPTDNNTNVITPTAIDKAPVKAGSFSF